MWKCEEYFMSREIYGHWQSLLMAIIDADGLSPYMEDSESADTDVSGEKENE